MKKLSFLLIVCALVAGTLMIVPNQQQADLAPPNPLGWSPINM